MSRSKPNPPDVQNDEIIALKLPAPERDVIITSRHLADSRLQDRIRNTGPREPVTFQFDELEDLHRGLAFESNQTDDSKRRKVIARVLRKIEDILDEQDGDEFDEFAPWDEAFENELPLLQSAHEIFANTFEVPADASLATLPSCRVALTAVHREVLLSMDTISGDIHKMLAGSTEDESVFEFRPRQIMVIALAIREAMDKADDEKSLQPYLGIAERISAGLYAQVEEEAAAGSEERYRRSQSNEVTRAYQLKITLEGSKPPIWRRVLVRDCTLDVLHHIVQTSMGWTNSHLHLFEYGQDRFSDPRFELEMTDYDESQVFLSQLVDAGCKKLGYWYDFGDDWWHTIKIEKTIVPKPADEFPRCVKGVGACPPEDVGGIWGYYEFVEALHDPTHERHAEFVEWADDDFDPTEFDLEETNVALAAGPMAGFD